MKKLFVGKFLIGGENNVFKSLVGIFLACLVYSYLRGIPAECRRLRNPVSVVIYLLGLILVVLMTLGQVVAFWAEEESPRWMPPIDWMVVVLFSALWSAIGWIIGGVKWFLYLSAVLVPITVFVMCIKGGRGAVRRLLQWRTYLDKGIRAPL